MHTTRSIKLLWLVVTIVIILFVGYFLFKCVANQDRLMLEKFGPKTGNPVLYQ